MRILLLDENLRSRQKLRFQLLNNKTIHTVDCPEKPNDLVREYLKEPADLVLIRLGNTRFNGLKLAKELLEADPQAKVAFVSQSRDYARLAFDAGAADYLLEPVDEKILNEAISRLCKKET